MCGTATFLAQRARTKAADPHEAGRPQLKLFEARISSSYLDGVVTTPFSRASSMVSHPSGTGAVAWHSVQ